MLSEAIWVTGQVKGVRIAPNDNKALPATGGPEDRLNTKFLIAKDWLKDQ